MSENIDDLIKELVEFRIQLSHLRADFDNHDKYTSTALVKAEALMNERLKGMNEFRNALSDQTSAYLTRAEYESNHKLIEAKLDTMQRMVYVGAGMLIVLQIAVGVVLHFI